MSRSSSISPQHLVVSEFFAGIGLVRAALERRTTGPTFTTAFANDIDPVKQRIYAALHPAGAPVDGRDIAALSPADIPRSDLWTASFPCTDLSLAGARRGIRAGQSGAVWRLLTLLERTAADRRPRWLLFENVMGLVSSARGADLRALVQSLNELGYAVDPMRVDAAHFTPQSRPRLFLAASPIDERPGCVDPKAVDVCSARPAAIVDFMRRNADLRWRAATLPPFPGRDRSLEQIIEPLPNDSPRWWSAQRVDYFEKQIHPGHAGLVRALRAADQVTYATAFRRVRAVAGVRRSLAEIRADGLAGCLRTPKGGSAKQILVCLGRGELRVRHLTPLECMRLQGLDRPVPEGVTDSQMLFALGDAVCVPAVRWVIDHALAPATIDTPDEVPMRSAPASIMAAASS